MRKIQSTLLGLGIYLASGCVVVCAQDPRHQRATPAQTLTEEGGVSDLACTTLGYLLRGRKPPTDPAEWRALLAAAGQISETGMVFSDAPIVSSLRKPRYLLALKEGGPDTTTLRPDLRNRVFMAFNLEWEKEKKKFKSARTEFQTWNYKKRHPEFGIITETGEARVLPTKDCKSCHKNEGAMYREFPWSNANVAELASALRGQLNELDRQLANEENARATNGAPAHYFNLLGDVAIYDATVRRSATLLRESRLLAGLPESVREKTTHDVLLRTLLLRLPGFGGRRDAVVKEAATLKPKLSADVVAKLDPAILHSDRLIDRPLSAVAGRGTGASDQTLAELRGRADRLRELERQVGNLPPGSDRETAVRFFIEQRDELQRDARQSRGAVLALEAARSSPDFEPSSLTSPQREENFKPPEDPAEVLGGAFDMMMGERSQDPTVNFLADAVDMILKKKGLSSTGQDWATTAKALLEGLLQQPEFADWMKEGKIPERHELIPAVVAALNRELKDAYGLEHAFQMPLPIDPYFKECLDVVLTSAAHAGDDHRCNRCHAGDHPQAVIPFDPMDPASRIAWGNKNDPSVVALWKQKLKRRVFEKKNMPPEDEDEAKGLNLKDPEFKSLRAWVDAK